jgi:hypothetical protein
VKRPTKRCGRCNKPKEIHFFSKSQWNTPRDCDRRCRECVKKQNTTLRPDRGVPGRVAWRTGVHSIFAANGRQIWP